MPEALARVKREVGPDAVILGTRTIEGGGLGRVVGRTVVEITAAPADTHSPAPRIRSKPSRKTSNASTPPPAPGGSTAKVAPPALRPGETSAPARVGRSNGEPSVKRKVVRATAASGQPGGAARDLRSYPSYLALVQNDVADDLARKLVSEAVRRRPNGSEEDPALLRQVICDYLSRTLPEPGGIELTPGAVRRVAFVGPSGAGKTTTMAKLAAHMKLRKQQRVAILSLDMHRLGSSEQLRRYAEIIHVPFATDQTVAGVDRRLRSWEGAFDLILMDTPGISLRDANRFARMHALLRAARPDEVHLVVQSSAASGVLTRVADTFKPFGVSKVVLTRLDETIGLGVVLNALEKLPWQLSYVSAGQNVPRDIEEACSKRFAELVLPAIQ